MKYDFIIIPKNSGLKICSELIGKEVIGNNIIEVRGEDVPLIVGKMINQGKNVIGITGEDLYKEFTISNKDIPLKIIKKIEWNDSTYLYKKPVLCLLGPARKNINEIPKKVKICINSKYKAITKKRCLGILENKGYKIEKIYASGSTEEFFSKGIVDLVIDIVCTGNSCKKYGLEVYDKIFESDIVIIGKKDIEQKEDVCFNMEELYTKIKSRIKEKKPESYTYKLSSDNSLLNRKIVEESAEVITSQTKDQLIWEFADLFYFLLVKMAKEEITLQDIEKENSRRNSK